MMAKQRTKLTHGDFRAYVTFELHKALEAQMNDCAHLAVPYYIHVRVNDRYDGPSALSASRGTKTKTLDLEGKQIIHNVLVAFVCQIEKQVTVTACNPDCKAWMGKTAEGKVICPVCVQQLGTILFRVDNQRGAMELVYALPPDRPSAVEDSDNYGPVVPKVAESAKEAGVSLFWN